jgi:hypothetical protein
MLRLFGHRALLVPDATEAVQDFSMRSLALAKRLGDGNRPKHASRRFTLSDRSGRIAASRGYPSDRLIPASSRHRRASGGQQLNTAKLTLSSSHAFRRRMLGIRGRCIDRRRRCRRARREGNERGKSDATRT